MTEPKRQTVIHAHANICRTGGQSYGMWVKLHRAKTTLDPALVPERRRHIYIGLAGPRSNILIAVLHPWDKEPTFKKTTWLAESFPITWLGTGSIRGEKKYAGRIYIPKPIVQDFPGWVQDRERRWPVPASVWNLPPDLVVLVARLFEPTS